MILQIVNNQWIFSEHVNAEKGVGYTRLGNKRGSSSSRVKHPIPTRHNVGYVISEAGFTATHLTDTDKQNKTVQENT